MRVVAGRAKGRLLRAPAGRGTRPTSDRVREAVFSMLNSMGEIEDAVVVDLFAGSEALGIEALSRGAAHVTFVDRDPSALEAVHANLAVLGADVEGAATVVRADAVSWAGGAAPADVVLADPPYAFSEWARLLGALAGKAGLVMAETGSDWAGAPGWGTVKSRRYGGTVVTLVAPATPSGPSE